MTEAELDRRLMALAAAAAPEHAVGNLEGFLDLFTSLKTAVISAGRAVATAVPKVASGVVKAGSAIGKAISGDTAKTLLATGGALYVANQQSKIENKKLALQDALIAQGYAPSSDGSQRLLQDIAREGVVSSDGRVLIPAAGSQRAGTGLKLTPILAAVAGLMAFAVVSRRGSKHA